jgi:hypothetical protein
VPSRAHSEPSRYSSRGQPSEQGSHPLGGWIPAEDAAGTIVQFGLHPEDVGGGVDRQGGALREPVPQQAFGVLVGRALSGRVRVADTAFADERFVSSDEDAREDFADEAVAA